MAERNYKEIAEKQAEAVRRAILQSRETSAFSDLRTQVRGLTLYRVWQSWLRFLRKFRLISFLLRTVGVLWTVLQTGAWIVLSTVLFLILLPILTATLLGVLLTALLESRRSNRQMKTRLHGKRVFLFFFCGEDSALFQKNLFDFSKGENACVLVISPFLISPRGPFESRKRRFYFTFREEAPNIYLVRRYYFFTLRKKLLQEKDCVYVY